MEWTIGMWERDSEDTLEEEGSSSSGAAKGWTAQYSREHSVGAGPGSRCLPMTAVAEVGLDAGRDADHAPTMDTPTRFETVPTNVADSDL